MATSPLRISGLDKLLADLKSYPDKLQNEVSVEILQAGDNIVQAAKRDAPTDIGGLVNGISKVIESPLKVKVVSEMAYSAFIEFGTRTKVKIPAGAEEFAAQFRGQKGSGGIDEMFANILDWVRRKGLAGTYSIKTQRRTGKISQRDAEDFDVAYLIVHSILTKGVEPHPFFFHNVFSERARLIERLKKLLNK